MLGPVLMGEVDAMITGIGMTGRGDLMARAKPVRAFARALAVAARF